MVTGLLRGVAYAGHVNVFELQGLVLYAAFFIALGVKGFALITAIGFPAEAYAASAKLTKVTWCAFLALGLVAQLISMNPLGLINIVFLVVAFVYLADVRPALQQVTGRTGR